MWRFPCPAALVLSTLCSLALLLPSAQGATQTDKDAPSPDETLALIHLNQYRADTRAADDDLCDAIRQKELDIDFNTFNSCKVGKGSAPALVFNRILNEVAHTLLAQGVKAPDKSHYDASQTLEVSGYAPGKPQLTMIVSHAKTLVVAVDLAFCNVVGEVPNGNSTRPALSYSDAMKPVFREAGIAVSGQPGDFNMIIILATGAGVRYVGGVAYLDANHDGRYQLGEGQAGVVVTCGSASMTTSASGAWWLGLDSTDAADVTFTLPKQSLTEVRHLDALAGTPAKGPAAGGSAVQALNWRIPVKKDMTLADHLIAATKREIDGKDDEHQAPILMKLLIATRMAIIDDARRDQIKELVAPVQDDFNELLHQVVTSLESDPDEIQKLFAGLEKKWKPVMPKWLKEAESLVEVHQAVTTYLALPKEQQPSQRGDLVGALNQCIAGANDPAFLEQYLFWLGMIDRGALEAIGMHKLDVDPPAPTPPASH